MRSAVIPTFIIANLMVFCFIADSKDLNQHDDIQAVQNEGQESGRYTFVSVSETNPSAEIKPADETRSVAETAPAEAKTNEAIFTEVKPVVDSNNIPSPAAVPVLTPEEAIAANEEANKNKQMEEKLET